MKVLFPLLLMLLVSSGYCQTTVRAVVADSISRQILPFATIRVSESNKSVITGINATFSITFNNQPSKITISYIGYKDRIVLPGDRVKDTIFLSPSGATLGEVIIRPQAARIKRIINLAVRAKPDHNPEQYNHYQCNIYYKMKVDMIPLTPSAKDTDTGKGPGQDTNFIRFTERSHFLLAETFSNRIYKKPQQVQETVLASRISGLQKTYFTTLVTDVLPFHIYSDYITLNGADYLNPIARGWQQRYNFQLYDELIDGSDTIFILSFHPKKKAAFNALDGLVYLNSNGYAISHFIATTSDTNRKRDIRIEQIFRLTENRWFPEELNYEVDFKQYPSPTVGVKMTGHSVITDVSFAETTRRQFDKAYPVRLGDSIDLYTEAQWKFFRQDSITVKERNTYIIIDSFSKKNNLENTLVGASRLAMGRLPIKKIDIDINRLIAFNGYEAVRLGAGFYTNDSLSRFYSVGGWAGYGFKDKALKYGLSATVFPAGNKDRWIKAAAQVDFQNSGNVLLHADIDRSSFRRWLLSQVDRIEEVSITGHTRQGYWEFELEGKRQNLIPGPQNNFQPGTDIINLFRLSEASLSVRYAYGEKRYPLFGQYFAGGTRYPVVYLRASTGRINAVNYSGEFAKAIIGLRFSKHINRWGNDNIQVEAGAIYTINNQPLSRSFLLAAKGFNAEGLNYYAWGGFLTMRPYDYFNDRYVSVLYKHDLDRYLWQLKYSKPFLSLAHNLIYGQVSNASKAANTTVSGLPNGYHESGIILNQLFRTNLANAAYMNINIGAFYHWAPVFKWQQQGVFVIGVSTGL